MGKASTTVVESEVIGEGTNPFERGVIAAERGPDFASQAIANGTLAPIESGAMEQFADIGEIAPEGELFHAEDLKDVCIGVYGWKWLVSSVGQNGHFAAIDIVRFDTGQRGVFVCGGVVLCEKLQRVERAVDARQASLPFKAKVILRPTGKKGQNPMVDLVSPNAA